MQKQQDCDFSGQSGRSLRKRKFEALERDSEILQELVETIQHSEYEDAIQIMTLIRSKSSLEDVRLCVQQQRTEAIRSDRQLSPGLDELRNAIKRVQTKRRAQVAASFVRESTSQSQSQLQDQESRRRPLSIAQLTDYHPYRVPARPRTTVTADDTLVSNMVSLWLISERGCWSAFRFVSTSSLIL